MSDNSSYYAERAAEERRLAMASKDLRVRAIHLEMARKYSRRARNNPRPSELTFGDRQETA